MLVLQVIWTHPWLFGAGDFAWTEKVDLRYSEQLLMGQYIDYIEQTGLNF